MSESILRPSRRLVAEELMDLFIFNEKLDYIRNLNLSKAQIFADVFTQELTSFQDQIWKTSFYSREAVAKLHRQLSEELNKNLQKLQLQDHRIRAEVLETVFKRMLKYFLSEENLSDKKRLRGEYMDFSLDRSFDWIDAILGINFLDSESDPATLQSSERMYLESGKGVQTNFGSIALILNFLDLQSPKSFFDLGSGFGRLGFFIGLLNNLHSFDGFEIVLSRVEKSNLISRNFGLSHRIQFHCKDLTKDPIDFEKADIFYLYDPFLDETYKKITESLRQVSRKKKIQVITKGNSKSYIAPMAKAEQWSSPIALQDGNINIFKNYQM